MTTTYPSLHTHASTDNSCPALWDALREVTDPEIPISVVDMGLIVDLQQQDGRVALKLTFTAMGCPAMEFIMDDIRERLRSDRPRPPPDGACAGLPPAARVGAARGD